MHELDHRHIGWLQLNAANNAECARDDLRALSACGSGSEWELRAVIKQEFSAREYAKARHLMGIEA